MLETTIAGSLPKPAWLAEPEKLWAAWRLSGAELEQGKQRAARFWMERQERAGIDVPGPARDGLPSRGAVARHGDFAREVSVLALLTLG